MGYRRNQRRMKLIWDRMGRFFRPDTFIALLFLHLVLFQIFLATRARTLYIPLGILFGFLVLQLLGLTVRAIIRQKALLLLLVAVFAFRLPFYLHPKGLLLTSDNAVEALQSLEIMDARQAPFFLHEAITHQGTVKYLWVSYLWEVCGTSYLLIVLLQTALFALLLILLHEIFKPIIEKSALWLLLALNFAFVETLWDYSLYLRGAPYLEMLVFFWLGVYLFQTSSARSPRIFLIGFFIFFSIYIHPLALFFVLSFLAAMAWSALRAGAFWRTVLWTAAGAVAGVWHWVYYLAFRPKVIMTGAWEATGFSLQAASVGDWLGRFLKNTWQTFNNIFSYEFSYTMGNFRNTNIRPVLTFFSRAVVWLSALVVLWGMVLALVRLIRLARKKERGLGHSWVYLFYLILLAGFFARTAVLRVPRVEPRNNFDLVMAVALSFIFVISAFLRPKTFRIFKIGGLALLLAAMTAPHYYAFLRQDESKQISYEQLLTALRDDRVKAVETDFMLAYPIYFLSHRSIAVSDTLGPLSLHLFYKEMAHLVDALPPWKKAYIFYADDYPARDWHKLFTFSIKIKLKKELKSMDIPFRVERLKDYVLFLPQPRKS